MALLWLDNTSSGCHTMLRILCIPLGASVILVSTFWASEVVGQSSENGIDERIERALCAGHDSPEAAIQACSRLLRQNGNDSIFYENRARAYARTRDHRNAVIDYTKAINLNRTNPTAYVNRGLSYRELGEFQPAITDLDEAIRLRPNSPAYYLIRGFTYLQAGKSTAAIRNYDRAIALEASNSSAFAYRGWARAREGEMDAALQDASHALSLQPKNRIAFLVKAMALISNGQLREAITQYDHAIQVDPHFWTAVAERGDAYRRLGRLDRALGDLNTAISQSPAYIPAYVHRGLTYEALRETRNAIADYRHVIAANVGLDAKDRDAQKQALARLEALNRAPNVQGPLNNTTQRIALLIGNVDYNEDVGPLTHPTQDVDAIREALRTVGFSDENIIIIKDADLRTISISINRYISRLSQAGSNAIGFFYYSGHGAANPENQTNYLIPIDARNANTTELWQESYPLEQFIRKIAQEAPHATHFIVLDACRNELRLTPARTLGNTKGFVPVLGASGTLVAYATALNKSAADDGTYAKLLAEEITKPGREAVTMFRKVQNRVHEAIRQDPYLLISPIQDIYFAGSPPELVVRRDLR